MKRGFVKKGSFPKFVIGNPNLIKNHKAAEIPDKDSRGRHYVHAFTLIELLVVVLIIGILSAIALPQYQKAVAKSRATELLTNLKTLTQAVESVYLETGTYPNDFTVLPVSLPGRIRDYGDKKNYILTTPSKNEFWLETGSGQISGVLYSVPTATIQLNYFIKGNEKGKIRCRANPTNLFANELCKSLGGINGGVVAGDNAYWLQ